MDPLLHLEKSFSPVQCTYCTRCSLRSLRSLHVPGSRVVVSVLLVSIRPGYRLRPANRPSTHNYPSIHHASVRTRHQRTKPHPSNRSPPAEPLPSGLRFVFFFHPFIVSPAISSVSIIPRIREPDCVILRRPTAATAPFCILSYPTIHLATLTKQPLSCLSLPLLRVMRRCGRSITRPGGEFRLSHPWLGVPYAAC